MFSFVLLRLHPSTGVLPNLRHYLHLLNADLNSDDHTSDDDSLLRQRHHSHTCSLIIPRIQDTIFITRQKYPPSHPVYPHTLCQPLTTKGEGDYGERPRFVGRKGKRIDEDWWREIDQLKIKKHIYFF